MSSSGGGSGSGRNYDYSLSVTGNAGSNTTSGRRGRRANSGGGQVKRGNPRRGNSSGGAVSRGSQRRSQRPSSASVASLAYSSGIGGRKRTSRRGTSPMSRSSASASRLTSSYGTSPQPQYRRRNRNGGGGTPVRANMPVRSTGLRGSGMASLYPSSGVGRNALGTSGISFGQALPSRRPASAGGRGMESDSFSISSRVWRS